MLHKTAGVVLKFIKYRDTSIIVKIYTEAFGLQTYIVNGVRKSKGKIALFQPLTLLDLVVYKKQNTDINRISQYNSQRPLTTIPFNITKSAVAVFITEVLYKCIKEDEEQGDLFEFIYHSIEILDELDEGYQNFHLQFLIKLSHHLGFGISSHQQLPHVDSDQLTTKVTDLINAGYTEPLLIGNDSRRVILDDILSFYRLHVDGFGVLNSVEVLKSVLH